MKWNPILRIVESIKDEVIIQGGDVNSPFEEWLEFLDDYRFTKFFESLQVNQKGKFILIRYGIAELQRGMWDDEISPYREARSVVIDLEKMKLVTCGFRKFFNINEVEENKVEKLQEKIKEAEVFEVVDKLDGSMQNARWYDGEIFFNGSMALDEEESWRVAKGKKLLTQDYHDMIKKYSDLTFVFEYISEENPHVVIYNEEDEGLYLLGARDVNTGYHLTHKELLSIASSYPKVKIAQKENKSLGELLELMKEYSSDKKEGWVIRIDDHFVKIKCDDYVNMHRILDSVSSENVIIKAIADGEYDDLLSKVPEAYRDRVEKTADEVFNFVDKVHKNVLKYYQEAPKEDKKEFMIWVTNNVPKVIQGFVREKYLGKSRSVLTRGKIGYRKMSEIKEMEGKLDEIR